MFELTVPESKLDQQGPLTQILSGGHEQVVYCSDSEVSLKAVSKDCNVEIGAHEAVCDFEMDIYAPCALGATLKYEHISELKCGAITGMANNQLDEEERHGHQFIEVNINYAPVFMINASGIINSYSEIFGYNREEAYSKTENIYHLTLELLERSIAKGIPSQEVAYKIAKERIQAATVAKLNPYINA